MEISNQGLTNILRSLHLMQIDFGSHPTILDIPRSCEYYLKHDFLLPRGIWGIFEYISISLIKNIRERNYIYLLNKNEKAKKILFYLISLKRNQNILFPSFHVNTKIPKIVYYSFVFFNIKSKKRTLYSRFLKEEYIKRFYSHFLLFKI